MNWLQNLISLLYLPKSMICRMELLQGLTALSVLTLLYAMTVKTLIPGPHVILSNFQIFQFAVIFFMLAIHNTIVVLNLSQKRLKHIGVSHWFTFASIVPTFKYLFFSYLLLVPGKDEGLY